MANQNISDVFNKIISSSARFRDLLRKIGKYKSLSVSGLNTPSKEFLASFLIDSLKKPIVIITPDISTALKYMSALKILSSSRIKFLPSEEISPYEAMFSDVFVLGEQLKILEEFKEGKIDALVINSKALSTKLLSAEEQKENTLKLSVKGKFDIDETAEKLVKIGYKRVSTVEDPGEFSKKGDILDVYPISAKPVRIVFFADEIENIKNFSIDTQRSTGSINEVSIEPLYKVIYSENKKETMLNKLTELKEKQEKSINEVFADALDITYENTLEYIEKGGYFEGIEYFAPLLSAKSGCVFDFFPEDTLVLNHESHEIRQKIFVSDEKYRKEYEENTEKGLALILPEFLHLREHEISAHLNKYKQLNLDSFIGEEGFIYEDLECDYVPKFMSNLDKAVDYIIQERASGKKIFIFTEYPIQIEELLKNKECPVSFLEEISEDLDISAGVVLVKEPLQSGFVLPDANLCVITDGELYERKVKKPTISKMTSKKENIDFLTSVNDISEGDFVVHSRHGIGKFIGMSKQFLGDEQKDYLTIEYAGNDKLYIPAEQINFLSRYRGSGTVPKLSKMGGTEWDGIKRKVKKSVSDIAQDLLNLYAKRAKSKGFAFEPDAPWQGEMEEAFPYTETPDQLNAINEVKNDMESDKPMDRLICGDVGFGKTEVALRAVFKAILSGKQVAVLAPTTILAHQHYLTFRDRFAAYPVKVELLSRFKSSKEQKETVKRLLTGECDCVIGTHRLLSKDIEFKNLGLVVIDEEHRFGVAHKEKMKHLRAEVDVIAMSATPIPRTLYMALSGSRDMSLINTPPVNRSPVKTYLGYYNEALIKTAISHELEREGQVYFVHNRVQSIYSKAKELQELLPDAKIAVAHGQLNEKELETIMEEFSEKAYEVLVCTTIIESGLDIPNVNTIIIDSADKMGLAQLYQLRGRVGRSDVQAYAYCFHKPDLTLSPEAQKRLEAVRDFTSLGSGYQIALRDLEIRGIGNILGAQQHGNMAAVGFDLYCNLLEESINELRGQKTLRKEPPVVDINITAYIPDGWIENKEQKMIEYKRLADVASLRELEAIQDEWTDRFGKIPQEVLRLIQVVKIRQLALDAKVNLIREIEHNVRIFSDYDIFEWKEIKSKLPENLAKRLTATNAPVSSQNGSLIINLNCIGLSGDDKLNLLEDLFRNITIMSKNLK